MAAVISEMSMSLDGFVADLSDEVGPLFDCYGNGPVETPTADPERWTFRTSEASARYLASSGLIMPCASRRPGHPRVALRQHGAGGTPFRDIRGMDR
jgi:hypothetical protein